MTNEWFGEGLTRAGNKLYQVTWLTNQGFIYSIPDLQQVWRVADAAQKQPCVTVV